jgi:hypothetical protein
MSTNTQDHQRYEDVIIKEVTNVDAGGWVGIITEEHGEIRCKSNLRKKLGLKKAWEGDLTVWVNPNSSTVCVAFDQKAWKATGADAMPHGQWSLSPDINAINPYDAEGFVYLIREKSTNKGYVGKKSYWNYSKGKRVRQSNWKTYASSGVDTAQKVSDNPEEFEYTILAEAPDKSALNYLEVMWQIKLEVLTAVDYETGEKLYYNKTLGSEKWMLTKAFIEEYNAKSNV